jgi:hypothetical protein
MVLFKLARGQKALSTKQAPEQTSGNSSKSWFVGSEAPKERHRKYENLIFHPVFARVLFGECLRECVQTSNAKLSSVINAKARDNNTAAKQPLPRRFIRQPRPYDYDKVR